jgi:hypothetical protein
MSYVTQLEHRVQQLQCDGVVDIHLFGMAHDTIEQAALAVLNLMDAPVVDDNELF